MATPPPIVTTADPAAAEKAFSDYRHWYGDFIDRIGSQVEKAIEVTKQLSTFHERLLLVSLGTIGLSLTALTTIAPRLASINFPRHTFLWYIVPAWISLLLCTFLCSGIMRQVVELNRTILEQWYQLTSQYSFHVGATSLTRLSQTMSGTMLVKSEEKDVSQHFTDLAKQLQKLAENSKPDRFERLLALAWGKDKTINYLSSVAIVLFQIGIVLLCVSAIKLFLNF